MINYGFSIKGKSHSTRNMACQDANKVIQLNNGCSVGLVADGVGSAKSSDIGAKIAVEKAGEYCSENINSGMNLDQQLQVLKDSFSYALNSINQYATENNAQIEDFDTTLSGAIYDGQSIAYGHAGDGGIVVKKNDGTMDIITEQQQGENKQYVKPLRAGEGSWSFGKLDNNIASVMLVTDGILNELISPFLLNATDSVAKATGQKKVYNSAAEFLMNPDCVMNNKSFNNPKNILESFLDGDMDRNVFSNCLKNGYSKFFDENLTKRLCDGMAKYSYPVWAIDQITDDKTVVCMMNEQAKVSCQPPAFYSEPDWQGLKTTYEKMVHPEKFANEQPKKDLESTQQINTDNNAKKQSQNKPKSEDNAKKQSDNNKNKTKKTKKTKTKKTRGRSKKSRGGISTPSLGRRERRGRRGRRQRKQHHFFTNLLLFLILICMAAAVAVGGLFVYKRYYQNRNNNESQTESVNKNSKSDTNSGDSNGSDDVGSDNGSDSSTGSDSGSSDDSSSGSSEKSDSDSSGSSDSGSSSSDSDGSDSSNNGSGSDSSDSGDSSSSDGTDSQAVDGE